MYWCKRLTFGVLFGICGGFVQAEPGDFIVGAGVETDTDEGLALSVLGDLGIGTSTWLSGALAHSDVEVPGRLLAAQRQLAEVDNWYADLALDHFFDPVGTRIGVAYWGSSELLESTDLRAAIYSRGAGSLLSFDGEYRDFTFNFPAFGTTPERSVGFNATGLGLSGRLPVSENVKLRASGMSYEYSREFNVQDTDRIVDVLTISRLSVLSSLVDWRVSAGISIDMGLRNLQLDVGQWRGVIDQSDNLSATLSFVTPLTVRSDIEFSLGYDDSDLYGDVTVFSVFVYFYGGS